MSDETTTSTITQEGTTWVSNLQLHLELKALRSDVRLWILGAVALNQFLASVDIPSSLTGAAFLGVMAKGVIGVLFKGGG
jgi:hypothetical protein